MACQVQPCSQLAGKSDFSLLFISHVQFWQSQHKKDMDLLSSLVKKRLNGIQLLLVLPNWHLSLSCTEKGQETRIRLQQRTFGVDREKKSSMGVLKHRNRLS